MKKFNILSVDDDPNFNKLLQHKLNQGMFNLITTATTKDFFSHLSENVWDACLVDVNLKEGHEAGFTLVKYIREHLKNPIPILIISHDDDHVKIAHALECGATDYLTKPFDFDMFTTKITYLLEENQDLAGQLKARPVPSLYRSCRTSADFTPQSINEEGITLIGPCCVSKGVMVEVGGPLIAEILESDIVRLMVTRNSKLDAETYSIFLEFGEEDLKLVENARKWILKKSGV